MGELNLRMMVEIRPAGSTLMGLGDGAALCGLVEQAGELCCNAIPAKPLESWSDGAQWRCRRLSDACESMDEYGRDTAVPQE